MSQPVVLEHWVEVCVFHLLFLQLSKVISWTLSNLRLRPWVMNKSLI